jgi:hypothetical protein
MITKDRFTAIVMVLVVWGLAGGVFGALFSGLEAILDGLGLAGWHPPVLAAAIAAMATSALYGAMPSALAGAMAGVLASIGALVLLGHEIDLGTIAAIAAVAGAMAGSFHAWMSAASGRPLMQTLTGLVAGLIAGGALVSLGALGAAHAGTFVAAAGVVAVVGVLFQVSERWIAGLGERWFPGSVSGAVVAALIATLVAASMWMLGASGGLMGDSGAALQPSGIEADLLPGFLGGMTGGAITGVVLELLGFRLEDHA